MNRERTLSQKAISRRNAELGKKCFVCGKILAHHTPQEAKECTYGWDKAIQVE